MIAARAARRTSSSQCCRKDASSIAEIGGGGEDTTVRLATRSSLGLRDRRGGCPVADLRRPLPVGPAFWSPVRTRIRLLAAIYTVALRAIRPSHAAKASEAGAGARRALES